MQYYISIHAPLAGCDPGLLLLLFFGIKISIHAPLAGCDRRTLVIPSSFDGFQSTHPLRGATLLCLRRAKNKRISIHAPLAGCDKPPNQAQVKIFYFNPRTPCGVRPPSPPQSSKLRSFQSTHPLRGATEQILLKAINDGHISIHAPLAGCDGGNWIRTNSTGAFQSTHPLRGATEYINDHSIGGYVFQSTHPLRGATRGGNYYATTKQYFNPRTPCGVRLAYKCDFQYQKLISIHAPLAGCDANEHPKVYQRDISIHAPLAGCDVIVVQIFPT